jgi:hypothetical protein
MSQNLKEHHTKAAEHHEHAAKHHRKAAEHRRTTIQLLLGRFDMTYNFSRNFANREFP